MADDAHSGRPLSVTCVEVREQIDQHYLWQPKNMYY